MFNLFRKKQISTVPIITNVFDETYLTEFVYQWSLAFPIDRYWRNKHKIAFNSPIHREVSFFDMRFEYEEDLIFERSKEEEYIPNTGSWLKESALKDEDENLTEEEKIVKYKKEFEDLDLSQYNDNG